MADLNQKIESIVLIPGSGEFVYDTEIVKDAYGEAVNAHFDPNKADAQLAVDNLKEKLPNLKSVSLVVGWFADSADPAEMSISPRVESKKAYAGDQWNVGDYVRSNTEMTKEWGGTPSDKSIIDIVKYLTDSGIKVTIYPMLYVDNEDKTWRGNIKADNKEGVDNFFDQYNKFVLHYANLEHDGVKLKDMVDKIIVGSEFVEMMRYTEDGKSFPAVDKMIELADQTKSIVGDSVKLTYAANWDEYSQYEGTFYMDKLWASKSIDMVGIDAYFKLTDGLSQDKINYDTVKHGWESGVDYDYYINDSGGKEALDPAYAIKNLKYWWENEHINADGTHSEWQPSNKPIIFTEFGFSSISGTTNDPSLYISNSGVNTDLSPGMKAEYNPDAQLLAIEASIDYWNEMHQAMGNDALVQEMSLYSFDLRGDFASDPTNFSDASDYQYGHWIKI